MMAHHDWLRTGPNLGHIIVQVNCNSTTPETWLCLGVGSRRDVHGTTGSLGCHLLEALARSSDVLHVYALNRASNNASLSTRQKDALVERAIDPCILDLPRITLLEGDLSLPNWGIPEDKYRVVRLLIPNISLFGYGMLIVSSDTSFCHSYTAQR